mmetsp:Transcript_19054/g.39268  ORF Transcript_19054/g.39268 Transcript_19054/m.39268 type:complete len:338 (-) Transcript_19054:410-1423(-)
MAVIAPDPFDVLRCQPARDVKTTGRDELDGNRTDLRSIGRYHGLHCQVAKLAFLGRDGDRPPLHVPGVKNLPVNLGIDLFGKLVGQKIVAVGQSRSRDDPLDADPVLAGKPCLEKVEHVDFQVRPGSPLDVPPLGRKARISTVLVGRQEALAESRAGPDAGLRSGWIDLAQCVRGELDDLVLHQRQTAVSLRHKVVDDLADADGPQEAVPLLPAVVNVVDDVVPVDLDEMEVGHGHLVVPDGPGDCQTGDDLRELDGVHVRVVLPALFQEGIDDLSRKDSRFSLGQVVGVPVDDDAQRRGVPDEIEPHAAVRSADVSREKVGCHFRCHDGDASVVLL